MAGNFYLNLGTGGLVQQIAATQVSAGSANAGQIVALNSSGVVDASMMPPGVGGASIALPATEALAAGAIVNIWSSSGVASVRNANATDATKLPSGFVNAAVSSGGTATVFFPGQMVTGVSGLTIGAPVFLSTTSGGVTPTAPSASGNLVCMLSPAAASATEFVMSIMSTVIHG
jgi:hypothetical protein